VPDAPRKLVRLIEPAFAQTRRCERHWDDRVDVRPEVTCEMS
jgi:hypothetical protein